ncbi:general substrate transporter [Aspergillus keveii]|uniref:General substrate transporter n=1 Tax=Aspergillus keveii TaxID=714993 RepID=A0ABR4FQA0_9EURO
MSNRPPVPADHIARKDHRLRWFSDVPSPHPMHKYANQEYTDPVNPRNGLNILPAYLDYFQYNASTTGLATASMYIGGSVAAISYNKVTNKFGRKAGMFYAALITILGTALSTSAQNQAMFITGRVVVGFGSTSSAIAGPTYLAETLPPRWRAWGLGIMNDLYYVGGLIAAGVTYGTPSIASTWSWRLPNLLQAFFSICCIAVLPFLPESPHWLVDQDRGDEALGVVAQTVAEGDRANAEVVSQFQEIMATIEYEKASGSMTGVKNIVRSRSARRRILLACSVGVFAMIVGNMIVSYYLGSMLTIAGVTDATTQLQINIIINCFCLVCAIAGTWYGDRCGRRINAVASTTSLTLCLYLVGILTSQYGDGSSSSNKAGVYGTVATIFLFQGSYSIGWTPLTYLYPPEVLNYSIRAAGMGLFALTNNVAAVVMLFAFPFAMENLGWKAYVMNASWNLLVIGFIWFFWVETNGRTLEEIDGAFEGGVRSRGEGREGKEAVEAGDISGGGRDASGEHVERV